MGTPPTVGVNNDLAASDTSITLGSTNDEAARWVQDVLGVVIEVLCRDNWLDDVLHEVLLDLLVGDLSVVLGGDDNGVDPEWDHGATLVLVFTCHLGLAIWPHPPAGPVLADVSKALAD